MHVSRASFAAFFVVAMITTEWEDGLFSRLSLLSIRLPGKRFDLGALTLVPALALATWISARLVEWPRRPWRWGPAPITLPVLGLGALALVRVWPVHTPQIAVTTLVAIAMFWWAFFYVLQDWPERWAVASLAVFLFVQGTIATLQFVRQSSIGLQWLGEKWLDPAQGSGASVIEATGRRWLRAYGLTPHPNMLGGYLSLGLLICLGAALAAGDRRRRWLWFCIGMGALGLFFTFSRAAWLSALLGLLYIAGVTRAWRRIHWRTARTRWLAGGLLAIGLVGALVVWVTYGDLIVTRFFRLGNPLEVASIQDRVVDARQAWGLIRTVPFKGTGSGYYLGALWAGVGEDRPPGFRKVHNVPLLATAELGIGGGMLWLGLLTVPPVVLAVQSRRRPCSVTQAAWSAAFVAAFVLGMLDNYLYVPSTWWSALYLGIVTGSWGRGLESR
jgi:hypothetical protein